MLRYIHVYFTEKNYAFAILEEMTYHVLIPVYNKNYIVLFFSRIMVL